MVSIQLLQGRQEEDTKGEYDLLLLLFGSIVYETKEVTTCVYEAKSRIRKVHIIAIVLNV